MSHSATAFMLHRQHAMHPLKTVKITAGRLAPQKKLALAVGARSGTNLQKGGRPEACSGGACPGKGLLRWPGALAGRRPAPVRYKANFAYHTGARAPAWAAIASLCARFHEEMKQI